MRIGIDAHIILPKHKRYDPKIAKYTEELISHIIDTDSAAQHTWVLFFDERMKDTKQFERPNVVIKHFPFVQYRKYLPVLYSHMLISAFLRSASLDVFHSPEGLIPFVYPGKIVTTFHYVPRGDSESNLFVRTFMLGARAAFAQLCKRAKRIIVSQKSDLDLLVTRHDYPAERVVVMSEAKNDKDWKEQAKQLVTLYEEVAPVKKKTGSKKKAAAKKSSKK
jgi:hypothetical protein